MYEIASLGRKPKREGEAADLGAALDFARAVALLGLPASVTTPAGSVFIVRP